MATRFACASCGKSVEAPDELAGRKARCPHCQAVQVVPGSPRPKIPARMLASAPGPRVVKSHANQFAGGLMAAVALGAVIAVMYFLNPKSVAPAAGPQQAGLIASGSGAPPDPTPTPRATPVATATPAMAPYITPIPGSAPTTASAPAAGPTTQIASPSAPQPTTPAGPTPVAPYTPVVVAPGGNANPSSPRSPQQLIRVCTSRNGVARST